MSTAATSSSAARHAKQDPAAFHFYCSSSQGNDSNAGTHPSIPVATLAKLKVLVLARAAPTRIALKQGDSWREAYDEGGTSIAGTTLGTYGSGSPPIVSGADVITAWTKTPGYTNVYQASTTTNGTGTNRAVVLQDGLLALDRLTSIAAVDAQTNSYYNADSGSQNPLITYVNVGGANPAADGHTYEIATRNVAIFLGAGGSASGIESGPTLDNNGAIDFGSAGGDCSASQCLVRYGTKHNILTPGGIYSDLIALWVDGPSANEQSRIPFVQFRGDATGRSYTLTRCHVYALRKITGYFSHTGNDPTTAWATGVLDQCIGQTTADGQIFSSNAVSLTVSNGCGLATTGGLISAFADTFSALRLIGTHNWSGGNILISGEQALLPQASWDRCAIWFGGNSTTKLFQIAQGGTSTYTRCSFVANASSFANLIGFASSPTGGVTINRCVLQANNVLNVPTGASYTGDNNVFVRGSGSSGPFANYHGTNYDLSNGTAFSNWKTATGQDANSIVLTASPFTGTPANGDFRISQAGDYGPSDHWDYELRSAVSGPSTVWPLVPTTLADARSYIQNPAGWQYYP